MNKMPTKIKILLFAMIAGAGLITFSIFTNIDTTSILGANINQVLNGRENNPITSNDLRNNFTSCNDIDSDGLCDEEEPFYRTDPINPDTDGDGFLDGEEVASNHDPTKPGPDDLLLINNSQVVNITDKISTLMTGAFYAGDLGADTDPEVYSQALADINIEMLTDGAEALDPNNISAGKTIFSSDSKKAQEKYLNDIGLIIRIDLWGQLVNEPRITVAKFTDFYTEEPEVIADSQQYFNSKTDYYGKLIEKVNAVPVPPSWLDVHQRFISNLQTLTINHQALSQTIEDPLKANLAMSNLIFVYQDIQPILVNITKKIKENDLNPPNGQLWSLINSLTDGF